LIIFSTIAAGLGQNIGGFITDKFGRSYSCYIGISILGVSIVFLSGHYSLGVMAVILSVISVGWTIAHNGISTILTDFSTEYRSELAALNSAVRFFSGGIGFWLSGSFVQRNFSFTFLIIGCLVLTQILFIKYIVPKR
jgi:MFS family permease